MEGSGSNSIGWRVGDLERRVGNVESKVELVPVLIERLSALADVVAVQGDELRGLRRAVIGFALTVGGSAVLVALTVIFAS